MNSDEVAGVLLLIVLGIIIVGFILMAPVHGNLFGYEIEMPLIGWIALVPFSILALVIFLKAFASR